MKGSDLDEEARNKGQYKLCSDRCINDSFNGTDSDVLITILNELHREI